MNRYAEKERKRPVTWKIEMENFAMKNTLDNQLRGMHAFFKIELRPIKNKLYVTSSKSQRDTEKAAMSTMCFAFIYVALTLYFTLAYMFRRHRTTESIN